MSSCNQLMRQVRTGNGSGPALSAFCDGMKEAAGDLSLARLPLNLVSFEESFRDQEQQKPHPYVVEARLKVRGILAGLFNSEADADTKQQVLALREENIRQMGMLSACTDRFVIFEYVLNRLEYRFRADRLPEDYSDETQAASFLEQLRAIEDASARQTVLVSLMEQLPMRMTRARFYKALSEGLNAYACSERGTVTDLLELLRSAALLADLSEARENYPSLCSIIDEIAAADLRNTDQDTFFRLTELAGIGMEELNRQMGLVMLLQELLNDTAVLVLTGLPEGKADICRKVFELQESSGEALTEEISAYLEQLEGEQEQASSTWISFTSGLDEIREAFFDAVHREGLEEEVLCLENCTRLLSGSLFASLSKPAADITALADEAWIREETAKITAELDKQFAVLPRAMTRGIMAKVLAMLPLSLRNSDELEAYIRGSLEACTDEAEKLACLELAAELLA